VPTSKGEGREGMRKGKEGNGMGEGGKRRGGREGEGRQRSTLYPQQKNGKSSADKEAFSRKRRRLVVCSDILA